LKSSPASAEPAHLRVLIVERSEDDAALLARVIRRGGFEPDYLRVDTSAAMKAALADRAWDVVICDDFTPDFGGPTALELLKKTKLDLPFIVISGKAGEDTAVDMLKIGAHDFIAKGQFLRLVPAIERELRQARVRREHRLAQVSPVGIFRTDADGNCLQVNERWCALAGMSAEQARGRGWEATLHPEDRERVGREWHECARDRRAFEAEYRFRRADGQTVWLLGRATPELGGDGRIAGWVGTVTDITELKAREALLARAERIAHVGSWEVDLAGNRLAYSDEALRIHGFERGQFEGTVSGAIDLVHPDDRLCVTGAINATLYDGKPFAVDFRTVRPDGTVRYVHADGEVVRDAAGTPVRAFGITQDVTERMAVEQALREERQRLGLLTDSVPAMIAYVDAGRRYRYANLRYRMFYAGSDAPVEGRQLSEVLTPEIWTLARSRVEQALSGEAVSYGGERRLRDGTARYVSVSLVPHRGDTGAVLGIYILALDVTAEHQAEMVLREREAGLRHAQEMAGLAHVIVRPDGSFERWSENWPRLIGLEPARLPRSTRESLELVHPEERERFRSTVIEAGRSRRRTVVEYRMRRGDGALVLVRQTMEPLGEPGADGRSQWFVTLQDVTEQKNAEEGIRRLNRVHAVLSGINGAIVRIRDRQELFDEVCRIGVELGGFRFAWLCRVDFAAQRLVPVASAGNGRDFLERIRDRLSLRDDAPGGHGIASVAVRENRAVFVSDIETDPLIVLKDLHRELGIRSVGVLPVVVAGKPVAVLGLHAPEAGFFDEAEQRLLQELAGDIAFALDHIEKEEEVRYLAYYDQVTGLANRTLFLERLAQNIAAAAAGGHRLALAVINIERFKTINDTFGRHAADDLLRQVAGRLTRVTGDAAHVARVGADHFAVVVPRFRRDEALFEAFQRATRRVDGEPYAVAGTELRISTQGGVALYPADGADAETLFRNAEAALRKSASGQHFLFYTPEMTARIAEKLDLENKLRRAVERAEFVLHYQPKLHLASRRIIGAEALVRWASPELGLVAPGRFIPLLEETGLIAKVGPWALARAIEDQQRWRARGLAAPRISVNVSSVELRRAEFVAAVKDALAHGVQPAIDLEITESLLMEDVEHSVLKLKALGELGVGVAIDDFGTGYSSLGYLTRLPAQSLKIDRSFIGTMLENPDIMTLVSTIISLAHALRLKVVAEGVESEAQAKVLRKLRCDEVQGYLFGKPVPADAFENLLSA
jgi:diguanylate cyclase (GGDEF)-like protein/PAS domain S-box-containing protein